MRSIDFGKVLVVELTKVGLEIDDVLGRLYGRIQLGDKSIDSRDHFWGHFSECHSIGNFAV